MPNKTSVSTHRAPAAVGPYSQAIAIDGLLWLSGQVALDPGTGQLVSGGIEEQTRQVLKNLGAVLVEGNASYDKVVKTTVYLVDMADFEAMNRVYAEFFPGVKPARVTIAVSGLPKGARVEIDAVAVR